MRNESACLKNLHSKSTDCEYQLYAVGGSEQLIYRTKKMLYKMAWNDIVWIIIKRIQIRMLVYKNHQIITMLHHKNWEFFNSFVLMDTNWSWQILKTLKCNIFKMKPQDMNFLLLKYQLKGKLCK